MMIEIYFYKMIWPRYVSNCNSIINMIILESKECHRAYAKAVLSS